MKSRNYGNLHILGEQVILTVAPILVRYNLVSFMQLCVIEPVFYPLFKKAMANELLQLLIDVQHIQTFNLQQRIADIITLINHYPQLMFKDAIAYNETDVILTSPLKYLFTSTYDYYLQKAFYEAALNKGMLNKFDEQITVEITHIDTSILGRFDDYINGVKDIQLRLNNLPARDNGRRKAKKKCFADYEKLCIELIGGVQAKQSRPLWDDFISADCSLNEFYDIDPDRAPLCHYIVDRHDLGNVNSQEQLGVDFCVEVDAEGKQSIAKQASALYMDAQKNRWLDICFQRICFRNRLIFDAQQRRGLALDETSDFGNRALEQMGPYIVQNNLEDAIELCSVLHDWYPLFERAFTNNLLQLLIDINHIYTHALQARLASLKLITDQYPTLMYEYATACEDDYSVSMTPLQYIFKGCDLYIQHMFFEKAKQTHTLNRFDSQVSEMETAPFKTVPFQKFAEYNKLCNMNPDEQSVYYYKQAVYLIGSEQLNISRSLWDDFLRAESLLEDANTQPDWTPLCEYKVNNINLAKDNGNFGLGVNYFVTINLHGKPDIQDGAPAKEWVTKQRDVWMGFFMQRLILRDEIISASSERMAINNY